MNSKIHSKFIHKVSTILKWFLKNRKGKIVLFTFSLFLITISSLIVYFSQEHINDRDFTKGVLVINTDKTKYLPNEPVLLQMSSLDPEGNTLCNSSLKLEITVPKQKKPTIYTTSDHQIVTTSTCNPDNNVTNEPDYITRFTATQTGTYHIKLINTATNKKVLSSFEVINQPQEFRISRNSASRINPFKSNRYPMVITVTAHKDFQGQLIETVPANFKIIWQGPAKISQQKDNQTLTWDVTLKAGESKEFTYAYSAPQVSPDFIKLGKAVLKRSFSTIYSESEYWRVASDGVITSVAAGGNWNTGGTWVGGVAPGTGDSAVIANTSGTVVLDTNPTILNITINAGSTLTNDGSTHTLTLTNTTGTLFAKNATGTFTPGTSIEVIITSASGSPVLLSAATSFYKLTINAGSGTVINQGAFGTTIANSAGAALTITQGAFNIYGAAITGPGSGNGTFTIGSAGIFCLSGTAAATNTTCDSSTTETTARAMPTFQTYSFDASSTVYYLGNVTSTVSTAPTYGNLELRPKITAARAYGTTASGTLTVNGNFNLNPNNTGASNFTMTLTLSAPLAMPDTKTLTLKCQTTTARPALTTGGNNISVGFLIQDKATVACNTNTITPTSSTITLKGTSGTLYTASGTPTFTAGTSTISVTSASGPVKLFSAARTIYSLTINSASATTVVNSGATPTFSSGGSLTITSGVLNFDTGVTGPGNSTLTIGASGTLCLGGTAAASNVSTTCNTGATSASAIAMPSFTTYTFNAASTVIYLSNAATAVSNIGGANYGNLYLYPVLSSNRAYSSGGATNIAGNFDMDPTGTANSLTFTMAGNITVASTKTTTIQSGGSATATLSASATGYNLSTGFLNITSTGTLTMNAGGTPNLTLTGSGASTVFTQAGTFNCANSTTIFNADADITTMFNITGTFCINNLSLTPVLAGNNRTYGVGQALTNVTGNITVNPSGTGNSLTVNLGGAVTAAATTTILIQGSGSATSVVDVRPVSTDYAISTGLINIDTGGTLDASSTASTILTLTGTSGTLFIRNGTFTITSGTPTVVFNGDGSPTALTSNTITFYNLSLTPSISTAGRTYEFGTSAITINGDFTIQPSGTQLLTVNMNAGGITVDPTKTTTITRNGADAATSKLVTGTNYPLSTGNLTVATNGTLDGTGSTSTITLTATSGTPLSLSGDNFTEGSTTMSYVPASGTANTVTSTTYYNLTLNHTGTTFSLTTSGITVTNNLTITAGVLDTVSGSNYPVTVGGNWTNSVGTGGFLAQSGTVTFNTATASNITGATIFNNLTCTTAGKNLNFGDATTFRVNGLLTLTGSSSGPSYVTLNSVTAGSTTWTINHQGTENITYTSVTNSACDGSSTSITMDGTSYNGGNNGTCWSFPAPTATPIPRNSIPSQTMNWNIDDVTDSTVDDLSGNGKSGTVTGATWQIASSEPNSTKRGTYLTFDGTGDYVSRSDDTSFNFGSASFSITGWFRHPVTISGTHTIFSRATGVNGIGYKVYMDSTGHICFGIDAVAGTFPNDSACTSQTYLDSTWHHFAAVKDSTTSISIYIDGRLGTTTTGITNSSLNGSATLYIGTDADGSSNSFIGDLDSIIVYSDALSASEVVSDQLDPTSSLFGANPTDPITNGLIGYWKLDETATPALDSSGNSNSGTWAGTAAATIGKYKNAITLDGNSDYINAGSGASLDNIATGKGLTVSAWVKLNGTGSDRAIVSKDDGGSGFWNLRLNGADGISFYLKTSGTAAETYNTSSLTDTTSWHLITGTYNDIGDRKPRIYLDGQEMSYTSQTAATGTLANDSSTNFDIGATGESAWFFNGSIDEVRVYNRALTANEITNLYNWAPAPIAWWRFDENGGTIPKDSSGNGNNCSLNSMPTYPWVTGKYGSALNFAATNDETDCGSPTILDNIAPMSLSAWVNPSSPPSGWGQILSKSTNDTPVDGWLLQLDSSNILTLTISFDNNGTNVSRSSSTGAVPFGTWSHVEATWDGTVNLTGIHLYVNGREVTYNGGNNATGVRTTDANVNFTIGNENSLANDYLGQIDDVRVYNYVRTLKQVIQDKDGSHPLGGSGGSYITAEWPMDEQQGQTITNKITTYPITTTLGTTSGSESSDPTWNLENNCKINGCLNFDGTDDVVTVTNTTAIDMANGLTNGFTISAWIYPETAGEGSGGRVFYKGPTTWLRVDTLSGGKLDLEASLDLVTTDATLNVAGVITQNAWNHIAMSYSDDGDDEITLWVNGKIVGISTDGVGSLEVDGADLLIGGDSTSNFDGRIDNFKIMHTELSPSEILFEASANSTASLGGTLGTHDSEGFAGSPPIGWWKLDENAGISSITDSSGNSYDGTLTNVLSTDWRPGKLSSALNLNGSSSYITATSENANFSINSYSIGTWIYRRTDSGAAEIIIDNRDGSNDGQLVQINATDNIECYYNATASVSTTTISTNTWYHVECTSNGTTQRLYINGAQEDSDGISGSIAEATDIRFGARSFTSATSYFPGILDNIQFYNYTRTPAQVAYDYNRGLPVAQYKLDECTGTNITNSVLNSNGQAAGLNGTLALGSNDQTSAGDCTTNANTAWYNGRSGKFSYSLNFDGNDDYVEVADNDSLDVIDSQNMMLDFWFKRSSSTTDDTVIAKKNDQTTGAGYIVYVDDANDDINFVVADGTDSFSINSVSTFTDATWHHVLVAYDDSSATNSTIYVDGRADKESTSGTIGNVNSLANALTLRIGEESDGTNPFAGQIDNLKVYNFALTGTALDTFAKRAFNEGSAVRFGPNIRSQTLALQPDATSGIDTTLNVSSANTNNATQTTLDIRGDTKLNSLVKFDLSSIPSTATVTNAILYLYVDSINSTRTDNVYRILSANNSWTETGATWNYRVASSARWAGDTGNDGGSDAGCSVSGTDYSSTSMGSWSASAGTPTDTMYPISLSLSEFELMRSSNSGMVLVAPGSDVSNNSYQSSDSSTATSRPRLVVTYTY